MIDESKLSKQAVAFLKRHDLLHKSPEEAMLSIINKVIRLPKFQYSTGVWRDYVTAYFNIVHSRVNDGMLTDNEATAYVGLIENAVLLSTSKQSYVNDVKLMKKIAEKYSDERKPCGCVGDCASDILNKEIYRCDG